MPEIVDSEVFDFEISQFSVDDLDVITEEPCESFRHVERCAEQTEVLKELKEIEQECSTENWGGMNELPVTTETIKQARELLIRSANLPYCIQFPNLTPTSSGLLEMEWYKEKGQRLAIRINEQGVFIFSGLFGQAIDATGKIFEENIHGTSLLEGDQFPKVIKEQLARLYNIPPI